MTQWSEPQKAIFEDTDKGKGHSVVQARAGCGKTTTILEALSYVPFGQRTQLVAFNKGIALEMERRAPNSVDVATVHSVGLKTVSKALGRIKVDKYRAFRLCENFLSGPQVTRRYQNLVCRVAGLCKASLVHEQDQIDALLDALDVDTSVAPNRDELVKNAATLLYWCKETLESLDFDDMIWLPAVMDLQPVKYSRLFVDETQDLSPAQLDLCLKMVTKKGRITAVGDDRQSIYQFRGAASDSLQQIVKGLDAKVLPLNITYRCPQAVVRLAREIVPDFEAHPSAPEGRVAEGSPNDARPGDFVLSRTNAPLVKWCLHFIKNRRKADILGKDLGKNLSSWVENTKATDIDQLRKAIDAWEASEINRLEAAGRPISNVQDRAETLRVLSDGAPSVPELQNTITRLFTDDADSGGRIILSTTHKAKGLEADRVFVLADTYRRKSTVEEDNLWYVAITRTKKELYLCESAL